MAFLDVDAVIAYLPGSMAKKCHLSVYLVKSRPETRAPGMSIVRILDSLWFERESRFTPVPPTSRLGRGG